MVDMRTICTLEIQPKIASALKIAGGQGLPHMDPSDSDAFGSAVAWMSASADADGLSLLAVGAARDISGADESESMPWRVRPFNIRLSLASLCPFVLLVSRLPDQRACMKS